MQIGRIIAGGALMAGGYGLAAMSGYFAFDGFAAITGAPAYGFIGPCIALILAGAGTALELELKARNWTMVVVCLAAIAGSGWLDQYGGQTALQVKEDKREAAYTEALAAYQTATRTIADAEALIESNDAKLAILEGPDVKAAQKLLGVIQDGVWGEKTTAAREAREAVYRSEIAAARDDIRAFTPTAAKGEPIRTAAGMDPHLYSVAVTFGAVVFSFLGSVVVFGLKPASAPQKDALLELERERLAAERDALDKEREVEARALEAFIARMNDDAGRLEQWTADWSPEAAN